MLIPTFSGIHRSLFLRKEIQSFRCHMEFCSAPSSRIGKSLSFEIPGGDDYGKLLLRTIRKTRASHGRRKLQVNLIGLNSQEILLLCQPLPLLLVQAQKKSSSDGGSIMKLIKKLLMIVARPARLLECLVSWFSMDFSWLFFTFREKIKEHR